MEELKLLVQMVASLPQLAVWALVGFYIYKICVIGSIYGTIRFVIQKYHDMKVTGTKKFSLEDDIHGFTIAPEIKARLIAQFKRLIDTGGMGYPYVMSKDVEWLKQAIDEKLEKQGGKNG